MSQKIFFVFLFELSIFKMCFKKKILPSMMIIESEFPTIEITNIDGEIEKYLAGLQAVLDQQKLISDGASDYLSKV